MSKLGIFGAACLLLLAPWACSVDSKGYTFATGTGGGGEIANAGGRAGLLRQVAAAAPQRVRARAEA